MLNEKEKQDQELKFEELKNMMKIADRAERQKRMGEFFKSFGSNLGSFLLNYWQPIVEIASIATGAAMLGTGNAWGGLPIGLAVGAEFMQSWNLIWEAVADSDIDLEANTFTGQLLAPGWLKMKHGIEDQVKTPLVATIQDRDLGRAGRAKRREERIAELKKAGIIKPEKELTIKEQKKLVRDYKPCLIQEKGKKVKMVFAKKTKQGLLCFSVGKGQKPFLVKYEDIKNYKFSKNYTSIEQIVDAYKSVMEAKATKKQAKLEAKLEKKKNKKSLHPVYIPYRGY